MADTAPKTVETTKALGRRLAASYSGRKVKADVVPHGHASPEVCEEILKAARASYGLSGSTESSRDEFLWVLAEVLVHGTSSEIDWRTVQFKMSGREYSMEAFASTCAQRIDAPNPVRVWVRDYDNAEVAIRMHSLLKNPDNLELRQVAVAKYETTLDNAQFCFDSADALLKSGLHFSHADILFIQKLKSYKFSSAISDGQSRGEVEASSNHAGTIGGVKQTSAPAPAALPTDRAGFKSLR